jgi:hypothetical protein
VGVGGQAIHLHPLEYLETNKNLKKEGNIKVKGKVVPVLN